MYHKKCIQETKDTYNQIGNIPVWQWGIYEVQLSTSKVDVDFTLFLSYLISETQVWEVTPHYGSLAGGNLLTISGQGDYF